MEKGANGLLLSDLCRLRDKPDCFDGDCAYQHRVTSMLLLRSGKALWVGTGSGHIVIFSAADLSVQLVFHRSAHPVRSIIEAKLKGANCKLVSRMCKQFMVFVDNGKTVKLVLTGCKGFRSQQQTDERIEASGQGEKVM